MSGVRYELNARFDYETGEIEALVYRYVDAGICGPFSETWRFAPTDAGFSDLTGWLYGMGLQRGDDHLALGEAWTTVPLERIGESGVRS